MPVTLSVNGVNYNYPKLGDENWGQDATNWAVGVTQLLSTINTLINNTLLAGIFELADATANTPALRFQNSLTTGIYRVSADTLGFSAAGVAAGQISSSGLLRWKNGSAATPAFSFTASPTSGLSSPSTNNLVLSTAGTAAISIDAAQAVSLSGDLTVAGTTTLNSVIFQAVDKNLTLNLNGTDASAEGGGLTIFRNPSTSASIVFDSTKASLWKAGLVGSEVELMNISAAQTVSNKTFSQSIVFSANNTYDLGSNSTRIKDIYLQGTLSTLGLLSVGDGTVSAPTYTFNNQLTTGLFRIGNGSLGFASAGTLAGSYDLSRQWTLGILGDTGTHNVNGSLKLNSASQSVTIDPLKAVALSDNQSSASPVFSLTATGNEHIVLFYSLVRGTIKETGTMHIVHDGTNARVEVESGFINGDSGVDFTADISAGSLRLLYTSTSTGNASTFKYATFRWNS